MDFDAKIELASLVFVVDYKSHFDTKHESNH
jgi:hypothetical protein